MIDIGRAVRPLIGPRQGAFAFCLIKGVSFNVAATERVAARLELWRDIGPIIQRGLKCWRDICRVGVDRQVRLHNNQAAITGAVFQTSEFHLYLLRPRRAGYQGKRVGAGPTSGNGFRSAE